MGRPRKKGRDWMPGGLYCNRRYYTRDADGNEIFVAAAEAGRDAVLRAFFKLPKPETATARPTLSKLMQSYYASPNFKKLAANTKVDVARAFDKVASFPTAAGKAFGDVLAHDITAPVMRRYMDKRGLESQTRADKELAYLSSMFSWAFERELGPANPCKGVRKFNPKARDRYVTDEEYEQRYALAVGRPDLQGMMELAYLARLRENEILKVRDVPEYMQAGGFLAKRGKGSKTQLIEWSPRLQTAVEALRAIPRRLPTRQLVVSPHTGRPLVQGAFKSAWFELKNKAEAEGHAVDWTFHDLKAKGVSDFEGDKHQASGHKTHAMTTVYDRRMGVVKSTR